MEASKEKRILILRTLSNEEIDQLKSADGTIYCVNKDLHESYGDKIGAKLSELSNTAKNVAFSEIQQAIDSIALPSENGSIAELFSYNGLHLWYYHRFRVFYDTYDVLLQMKSIEEHASITDRVIVYGNSLLSPIYEGSDKIQLISSNKNSKAANGSNFRKNLFELTKISFKRFFQGIAIMRTIKRRRHILVVSHHHYLTDPHNPSQYYNPYLHNLLHIDDQNEFAIIDVLVVPKLNGDKTFLDRSKIFRKEAYPLIGNGAILGKYGLFNPICLLKSMRYKRHLRDSLIKIQSMNLTQLQVLMVDQMSALRKTSMFYYFQFHAYRRFFAKSDIKTVTAYSEQSANIRSIIDAAKSNGIITIGIQHGVINENNRSYNFTADDKIFHPHPDYTLVWGDMHKNALIKGGCYDESQIAVVGQLRSDEIHATLSERTEIIKKFASATDRIFVFASQPQKDESLRKKAAIDVMNAANQLTNAKVIIKAHPIEDVSYYNDLKDELECLNCLIVKDEIDLYQLIKISSGLITCFSTVGGEAVHFIKPLLVLDYLHLDQERYCASGVGKLVTSEQDIVDQLNAIINNTFIIEEDKYRKFTRDRAFQIDGQAVSRAYNFIKSKG